MGTAGDMDLPRFDAQASWIDSTRPRPSRKMIGLRALPST